MSESTAPTLTDIQASGDNRGLCIDRVGISGLSYPITVLTRSGESQTTVGRLSLSVSLPHHVRGTHMSRFIEVFERHRGEMTMRTFPPLLDELREVLEAEAAETEVAFPYFLERAAPVSGKSAPMDYYCTFRGRRGPDEERFTVEVTVPVTTLCPCSKEISDFGAHNQRGYVKVEVLTRSFDTHGLIWIEEIINWVEESASAPLYPLLKRPDERFVTMQAYENPRFVEDVVREVGVRISRDPRADWFHVAVENLESIHNHSAFAEIEWTRDPKSHR